MLMEGKIKVFDMSELREIFCSQEHARLILKKNAAKREHYFEEKMPLNVSGMRNAVAKHLHREHG